MLAKIISTTPADRCERFYDLPTTRERRTTSFGVGGRTNFSGRENSPPPGTYKLPSDFEGWKSKGRVFSFGISRDAYSKVYVKEHPVRDASLPGPGTYDVREVPGKDAKKVSFRPKTTNPRMNFRIDV